jgi:hypothetical protein
MCLLRDVRESGFEATLLLNPIEIGQLRMLRSLKYPIA